ncbi:ABC transporter permease [Rhizobium ruizarguesonis]|uniref:ABC transporter permease n=1 Tax=Rhizobium ruizarguesonis TaxID=2081791 RepID=UPI00103262DE|nr:ABC transporter permease [Rhizobium ruizarguesonis]TAT96076.1 ABC transporter permease [Rhizobium ruizarguesonis]
MSMTSLENYEQQATRPAWIQIALSRDGSIGFCLIFSTLILIVIGPFIAPYSPTEMIATANMSPTSAHWLGTDHLGRDVLSRFLSGGRSIIAIPLIAVAITYLTAGLLSLTASYKGGWFDLIAARFFEFLMSLPSLLKILLLVAAFGPSTPVLIAALAISNMPGSSRVVRGAMLSQAGLDYVQAAQARGDSTLSIVTREILPNILGPVAADFTLRITWGIIALSTLSFLGLGVQPPQADWGLMIQEGRASLRHAPLVAIVPAIGIACLSVGFNLAADAMVRHMSGARN